MLTDPALIPFEPPAEMTWRGFRRNFIESFPRSSYEQAVTRIKLPCGEMMLVCDPDLIRELLVQKDDEAGRNAFTNRIFTPVLSDLSVFLAEGAEWRWKRAAVMPSFRARSVRDFVPVFSTIAERQVEHWRGHATATPVDAAEAMREVTFDIIVATMLGNPEVLDAEGYARALTDAFEAVPWHNILTVFAAPRWTPYPGRRRLIRAREYLHREVGKIVAERHARAASSTAAPDLLDQLMEARDSETGRRMTDPELVSNLITFISTGHEVSALALTWALWLVALDPEVQERVAVEAGEVAGAEAIEPHQVESLSFTRQVIEEAMRLYPPAPVLLRQARVDMTLGDHRVKAGTHLVIPTFCLHRNSRLWPNPNSFDPDRFAAARDQNRPRYAFLPFGAGPRVCIGASFAMIETVVILATLLRSLRFRPVPGHQPRPVARITLRAEGGMPLLVAPR